jgi:hypothetical protein
MAKPAKNVRGLTKKQEFLRRLVNVARRIKRPTP